MKSQWVALLAAWGCASGCGDVKGSADASFAEDGGAEDGGAEDGGGGDASVVEESCDTQFVPWFRAGFAFPDGGNLGVADFPSSRWRAISGQVSPQGGWAAATASAVTVASQGATLGGATMRIRAMLRASMASDETHVLVNADSSGESGLEVGVAAATGELSVSAGGAPLASTALGALELDTDYYLEGFLDEGDLSVSLAKGSYGSVPDAEVVGSLEASDAGATGEFTGLRFVGGGKVDNLSVALCGRPAPTYERRFFDDFNRSNSDTLGQAVEPPVTWDDQGDPEIKILGSRLYMAGVGTASADVGEHHSRSGLRLRASLQFPEGGWGYMRVQEDSFWIFRYSDTVVQVRAGLGSGETFPVSLSVEDTYYAQLDLDATHGILTLRSGSFEGPVLFVYSTDSLPAEDPEDTSVQLASTGDASIFFDDVAVHEYVVP